MNIKHIKSCYEKLSNEIFCLSLNKNIKVTKSGYNHVFKEKVRPKEEILNRITCLNYVPELLQKSSLYQWSSKQFKSNGNIEYWNIEGVVSGVCVCVTLRKIGNQEIHLYSWHYKGKMPKII